MAEGSSSPRLYLERCDDIDLLSEMLSKHSDTSTDDHDDLNVSGKLLDDNVDELSNYLCGNSNTLNAELAQCRAEHDPFMSPTASAREARSGHSLSSQSSSGTGLTSLITRGNTYSKVESTDSKKVMQTKSVVLVVPQGEAHANVNKNALAARENRKRKKQYVQQLEVNVNVLETENAKLNTKISSQEETIDYLKEQVKYLQSVIENQSTLSALLKNIENTSGVQLKSSWSTRRKLKEVGPQSSAENTFQNETSDKDQENKSAIGRLKRKCEFESENIDTNKRVNVEKSSQYVSSDDCCSEKKEIKQGSTGGVCLHVSGSEVSLEFCVKCSEMASTGKVLNDHTKKSRKKSPHIRKFRHKD